MACLDLDRLRAHPLGRKALQVGIDRPVLCGNGIETRLIEGQQEAEVLLFDMAVTAPRGSRDRSISARFKSRPPFRGISAPFLISRVYIASLCSNKSHRSNVATRYSHVRFAPGANEALGRLRTKICVLQAPRQIGFARRGLKYNFPLGERIDSIRDGQRLLD